MKYIIPILSICFSFSAQASLPPVTSSNTAVTVLPGQKIRCNTVNASQPGCLSAADWTTFNNKLDASRFNYITNSDAEIDTAGWNLYNDSGRTTSAFVVDQDITYTSTLLGDAGNGATLSYTFCGTSYVGPIVTCPTGTSVQVCWYNGPTLAQNPTAAVLKAAYDAQSCATAIATSTITGTSGNKQYETGTVTLSQGGDTSPVDGTGGVASGVTFTRSTSSPLVGIASFDLGKDAANREGQGVSTDFTINSLDKGNPLQINVAYSGSSGMVLGSSSDIQVFLYDVTNAVFLPITPLKTIAGPVNTAKTFVGTFTATSTSVNYRLTFHIATPSASAWHLELDRVVVNNVISTGAATQVPSVVLNGQVISNAVTDHMAVVWNDAATTWVPALDNYTDFWAMYGFATNIVGLTADVYVKGKLGGFSFGPFAGYNQYVDAANAGLLTPIYPGNANYVIMGKAISATEINIQPFLPYFFNVASKGGLFTSNGTTDTTLTAGTNGAVPYYNSANANGWATGAAVVSGSTPLVYNTSTRTLTIAASTNSVAGTISAAEHTALHPAVTIGTANGLSLSTQTLSLAAATDSVPGAMTAVDHTSLTANTAASHAALTLAAIGAVPNANGASLSTQALTLQPASASFGGVVTTGTQTFAGVKTLAAPILTGDVNLSTGNLLISTIGKSLSVKTGTNAKIGTAVLVGGTATVANTSVTANSRIFLSSNTDGGTPGWLRVSAKTLGTSFVITSSSATDTSTVAWHIVESIP